MSREDLEKGTGKLFEALWAPYDDTLFEDSVQLFTRRLDLIDFDQSWFAGKTVLDAGCGGGRNTIAMARLGTAEAQGIDLGAAGIANARERAARSNLANTSFQQASILEIPFEDDKFDLVWCAGVMMITDDEDRALDELTRVLKPGGMLYLLVYADEGMRWPLIETLRPIAARLGQAEVERAMEASGMPANKRRTFLDDLFCPKLDFYNWERLRRMLEKRGFGDVRRWPDQARLDHEQDLEAYRLDLQSLCDMWAAGAEASFGAGDAQALFRNALVMTQATIDTIKWFEAQVAAGKATEAEAMGTAIGQGHHRLFATKGAAA
jgi:ubiquinone/menaquinone biosynthesis C-methylase UbiE